MFKFITCRANSSKIQGCIDRPDSLEGDAVASPPYRQGVCEGPILLAVLNLVVFQADFISHIQKCVPVTRGNCLQQFIVVV